MCQIPVTFHPRRRYVLLWLIILIALVTMSVAIEASGKLDAVRPLHRAFRHRHEYSYVNGWVLALAFSLPIPFCLGLVLPQTTFLRLEADGFSYAHISRPRTVRWADVQEFRLVSVPSGVKVVWDYLAKAPADAKRDEYRALGYEACLPSSYGQDPSELAALMEDLRVRQTRGGS